MTWLNASRRRAQLPPNWSSEIVPTILARDPTCRCPGCTRCRPTGCRRPSTDVDHHNNSQLRGLCHDCHALRTAMQGVAARGHGPTRQRPAAPHPGLKP